MKCINCHKDSDQKLCQKCRDTAPYSNAELDSFLQLLNLFGEHDDEHDDEKEGE